VDPLASPVGEAAGAPGTPRITRGVLWLVALIAGVEFMQFTIVQPEDVQGVLGFRRGDLDGGHWWSVGTYPFAHASTWMAAMNAYALLIFGPRLERTWGMRRFLAFAALAALGGWMLHLFIAGAAPLLGASAMALGVLTAYSALWGGDSHQLAGGLTMSGRWVAFLVAAILVLVGLQEPSAAGGGAAFVAHLGGVVVAGAFVRATRVTFVEQFREGVSALPDEPPEDQPPRAVPKTLPRSRSRERDTIDDVVARSNAASSTHRAQAARQRPPADTPTETPAVKPVADLDAILDKISAEGIETLTADERRVLDDHSRRLRDR
jgi:membrane associated rhomboid family serine protease